MDLRSLSPAISSSRCPTLWRSIITAVAVLALSVSFGGEPTTGKTAEQTSKRSVAADDGQRDRQSVAHQSIAAFLQQYCSDCHGEKEQKADRRFDQLAKQIRDDNALVDYQDIVDQLNLGQMPPDDARQPSDGERQRIVDALSQKINRYHETRQKNAPSLTVRRMNSREYRNTIRDLLALDMTMFDPTRKFPRDQTVDHMDNQGDTLVLSGHLLARYLDAAETIVHKAMGTPKRPEVQHWYFTDDLRQQPEIDQVHGKTNGFDRITLYDVIGADKPEGAYGPILAMADGVPSDGFYTIRVHAEALHRINPYDPEFLGTDPSEPLRLGIVAGNRRVGKLHLPQPIEPLLAEQELEDRPEWYTFRVWLDEGYTPRFTFQNGLMDVRNLYAKLIKRYRDQFPKEIGRGIVAARFNAIKYGKLPQIQIHEIEIDGPHFDQWPTPSQRAMLIDDWMADDREMSLDNLRERVTRFASRAYRRPAHRDEVDRVMQVIDAQRAKGRTWAESYGDGLKVILCSPSFLYLNSVADVDDTTDYALASRLSYFLWSSMPDAELTELASQGRLRNRDVLRQQAERMLGDKRSDAFIQDFLNAWLGLNDLGSMPPDRSAFRDYYHHNLDPAMRRETFLFMRSIVDQNLPTKTFLDSDFTFVNRPLARLYEMEPPQGYRFQRVSIDDERRGGLLGQASILTLTANGVDTSPVVRGVWLLDRLLGSPPSPPPPDVPPLDPDTRGAKTIREQLEMHRDNVGCYECHRKIDPPGFALENFDPIGRWRDRYDAKHPVDAAGQLPDGQSFHDIRDFKQLLLQRPEPVVRSLVTKLASYGVGRRMTIADRPELDRIIGQSSENDYPVRDLILSVVTSDLFALSPTPESQAHHANARRSADASDVGTP